MAAILAAAVAVVVGVAAASAQEPTPALFQPSSDARPMESNLPLAAPANSPATQPSPSSQPAANAKWVSREGVSRTAEDSWGAPNPGSQHVNRVSAAGTARLNWRTRGAALTGNSNNAPHARSERQVQFLAPAAAGPTPATRRALADGEDPNIDLPGVAPASALNPFDDPFGDKPAAQTPPTRSISQPVPESDGSTPPGQLTPEALEGLQTAPGGSIDELPPPGQGGGSVYNQRQCDQEDERCRALRSAIRDNPIAKISLDITPTYRLSGEAQVVRDWMSCTGAAIATGSMVDLRNGRVVIRTADGGEVGIPLAQLSDDDLCFVAAWYALPSECRVDDVCQSVSGNEVRPWVPLTYTWKASALCHKPLYFEQEALERYGHTTGPVTEPFVAGAHFFVSIAALPYWMGINPPNECQYALGHYRPGSCAPWLIDPIPLSARGALYEAGAITGAILLFP